MTTNFSSDEMLDDDFLVEFDLSELEVQMDDGSECEEEQLFDPCPICGEPEVEIETGFCCRCNALLNGAAAVQVLGRGGL